MKIAIFQPLAHDEDCTAKLSRVETYARRAASAGAKLLVCPELMLSGYNVGTETIRQRAENRSGSSSKRVAAFARQHNIAIVYGYPERDGENIYNAAAMVDNRGDSVLNYRKTHLFGSFERETFTAGSAASGIVDLDGWRLALLICYDIEFPENSRHLALRGADLVVVPTALMSPYDRVADLLVPARAYENGIYVAYANCCGSESQLRYCGKSTIAMPDGQIQLQGGRSETLIIGELSRDRLDAARKLNPYLQDRRPEIYSALACTTRRIE